MLHIRPVHGLLKRWVRIKGFCKGGCESLENSDFEAKVRGVNSVSDEKLHDFEIICLARGCMFPPHPLPHHHPCVQACILKQESIVSK